MDARETAEIEALRDLFAAVPEGPAGTLGVSTLALGADAVAVQVELLSGSAEVNHALGITSTDQLDALAGFYGTTVHAVSPAPGADLDAELRARGYAPGYAWMKFARGPDAPPDAATDLQVVEVGADRGADFGRVAVEGYGMPGPFLHWFARLPGRPGWHCFVAYDGAEPAASGALHVHDGRGWLGLEATRSAHRRRGAQGALLAARIHRAVELGCTLLVTETGELVDDRPSGSYRNILRAGFEPQYLRPNYAPMR